MTCKTIELVARPGALSILALDIGEGKRWDSNFPKLVALASGAYRNVECARTLSIDGSWPVYQQKEGTNPPQMFAIYYLKLEDVIPQCRAQQPLVLLEKILDKANNVALLK